MVIYDSKCVIWPEFDAFVTDYLQDTSDRGDLAQTYVESRRAGGRYRIDSAAQHEIQQPDTPDELRKKVSWWLASQRRQNVKLPLVTSDILSYLRTQRPLHVVERAGWLLWYLADQTAHIGHTFPVWDYDDNFIYGAMAATQSSSTLEMEELTHYLLEKQALRNVSTRGNMLVRVTVAGFEELRRQTQAPDYAQAFVAMWLDDSVRELYDKGISPAIECAGYKPYLVPEDLSADKIDDAIIANIRQSKFVVADVTHGKGGHRGSVYYEAGFADGLGLEVILTCRRDLIDDGGLAFDTRQRNHIAWDKDNTNYDKFIQELTNRIIARVGRGPIQDNA